MAKILLCKKPAPDITLARAEASFVPDDASRRHPMRRDVVLRTRAVRQRRRATGVSDTSSEDDSDAIGDDDEGVGPSSTGAAAPAAAPEPKTVLPSADDVFGAVKGPPAFLRPEATRPLASAHRNPTADGDGDGAGDRVGDDVDDASRKRRAVASATVSSAPKGIVRTIYAPGRAPRGLSKTSGTRGDAPEPSGDAPGSAGHGDVGGAPEKEHRTGARHGPRGVSRQGFGPGAHAAQKGGLERMEQEKKKRQSGQNGATLSSGRARRRWSSATVRLTDRRRDPSRTVDRTLGKVSPATVCANIYAIVTS